MSPLDILSYLCWAASIGAVLLYAYVLIKLRRGLNGLGLIFTAMALAELPAVMRYGAVGQGFMNAVLAAVCLLGASIAQMILAVRGRTPWEGADRREERE